MDSGISRYDKLINELQNRSNISLQITKNVIEYENNKNEFIYLLYNIQNLKKTFDKLENVDDYLKKNKNDTILFEYEECFCNQCNNIENQNCRKNCHKTEAKKRYNKSLKDLKNNNDLLKELLSNYKQNLNENLRNSSLLFQKLKEYYKFKLYKNNTLENDLKDFIEEKIISNCVDFIKSLNNQ